MRATPLDICSVGSGKPLQSANIILAQILNSCLRWCLTIACSQPLNAFTLSHHASIWKVLCTAKITSEIWKRLFRQMPRHQYKTRRTIKNKKGKTMSLQNTAIFRQLTLIECKYISCLMKFKMFVLRMLNYTQKQSNKIQKDG